MLNCYYTKKTVLKAAFVCVGRRFKYRSDNAIFKMSFLAATVDCLLHGVLLEYYSLNFKANRRRSPDLTEMTSKYELRNFAYVW